MAGDDRALQPELVDQGGEIGGILRYGVAALGRFGAPMPAQVGAQHVIPTRERTHLFVPDPPIEGMAVDEDHRRSRAELVVVHAEAVDCRVGHGAITPVPKNSLSIRVSGCPRRRAWPA